MTITEARRLNISADGIRSLLDLPPLRLPERRADRDELLAAARASALDCAEAIRSYLEAIRQDPDTTSSTLFGLPSVFFGWSAEQAADALQRRPRIMQQWMVDALSPAQRPSGIAIADVQAIVRQLSSDPGWNRLSAALVTAWVDEHCAAVSDHDAHGDLSELEVARMEAAKAWPRLARKAIEWPEAPFGVWTQRELSRAIERLFRG